MDTNIVTYKPDSAIAMRREMANMPAVMGALDALERSVFLASIDKPMAEYDDRDLAGELAKALKFIAKDVGCRESDEAERGYLVVRVCEIMKRYYDGFTMRDFRLAFEMSITGELDDYLPRGRDGQADRGHYQQFNAEYICKILNAYRARRNQVLRKANEAKPKPQPERDYNAEIYYRNRTRQECIFAFEYFKSNKQMPEMSPIAEMLYYKILSDAGLADKIVVTDDETESILKRTIERYAQRGMVGDVERLRKVGTYANEIQHDAFISARYKALKATFERLVADNVNLKDYIKFESEYGKQN